MVKNTCSTSGGTGLIPGQGTKIPLASGHSQKQSNKIKSRIWLLYQFIISTLGSGDFLYLPVPPILGTAVGPETSLTSLMNLRSVDFSIRLVFHSLFEWARTFQAPHKPETGNLQFQVPVHFCFTEIEMNSLMIHLRCVRKTKTLHTGKKRKSATSNMNRFVD